MKRLLMTFAFAALAGAASAETRTVALGDRSYVADLPAQASGAMILALHGAGENPDAFRKNANLSAPALAEGYTVLYPAGSGENNRLTWNATYCCGYAVAQKVDDMAFLDAVIADATSRFSLDPKRVYLAGMSNGSMMAETYAARRAGKVKAVAGVSGPLDLAETPAAAVPLLHIHGLADEVVPYDGGYGRVRSQAPFTAVPDLIRAFVAAEGPLQKQTRVIDPAADGMSVTEDDYVDAAGLSQVRLFTIAGGVHGWPGGVRGKSGLTEDISAPTEILKFFDLHP